MRNVVISQKSFARNIVYQKKLEFIYAGIVLNDIYVYVVTEVHEAAQHIADSSRVRDDKDFFRIIPFLLSVRDNRLRGVRISGEIDVLINRIFKTLYIRAAAISMLVFVMFNFG